MYLYPLFVRLWHLLNALFFLVLIATGLSMQYSNPDNPVISFPLAVKMHNICGIGLSLNYLIFLVGNAVTGNGKHYRLAMKGLGKRLRLQLRHYMVGIFRKEDPPFPITEASKFNPLQAVSYAMAMYIGLPVLLITGWGMLFPETVLKSFSGVGGILLTDLLHVITGFILSVFMIVHIYMCTIGTRPGSNFVSMITGWHKGH